MFCVRHRAGHMETGAGVEMGNAGGAGGFVQGRNGDFSGNGNLALSRLLALLSSSFPRTWIHKNFAVWVVLFLDHLLLQQHSFPFCLQLGIFCFIVADFLTAGKENICQDVSSEQEILITSGTSSGFSCCRSPS